jgi:L-cysteine desulfidase
MITKENYATYVQILKDELVPAMGCTEPIAIAYAGAVARKHLGGIPKQVSVNVSGNIIKNVKSVIVPHTGGMRGIAAAAAVGIVAGDPDAQLEVISSVNPGQIEETRKFMENTEIQIGFAGSEYIFDIMITLRRDDDEVFVRITDSHRNVVTIRKNEELILSKEITGKKESNLADKSQLTIEGIYEFAEMVKIEDVKEVLDCQMEYNMTIAEEGIQGSYGANIGKVILKNYDAGDVKVRARAMAAAGSDARMNGCELPVVINSGSGNQGITASVPVVVYAKELGVSEDKLYRALVISNLTAIHVKSGIGCLSAYCGAVGAGCASGVGISYLCGGGFREGAHTLVNGLAIISGMICDGAKASCAAKIAFSVDAGILGYEMFKEGQQFTGGDGIVKKGVENTIRSVGTLASQGMLETDKEIVKIMID